MQVEGWLSVVLIFVLSSPFFFSLAVHTVASVEVEHRLPSVVFVVGLIVGG